MSELVAALEAATGPSRELDAEISTLLFGLRIWKPRGCDHFVSEHSTPTPCDPPAYTRSLDAITGAVEQRWPSRYWSIGTDPRRYGSQSSARLWLWDLEDGDIDVIEAHHRPDCPALALCLAAARLSEREALAREGLASRSMTDDGSVTDGISGESHPSPRDGRSG